MNIFILDYDPKKSAEYHTDKHIIKMILESTQMLSTAVRLSGIDSGYRATHKNHPCNVWLRESLDNWIWLRNFVYFLHDEYQYRYGDSKIHKSFLVAKSLPEPRIERNGMTNFKLAMPEIYKESDPVQAYRNYYKSEKQHLFSWKKRGKPNWL